MDKKEMDKRVQTILLRDGAEGFVRASVAVAILPDSDELLAHLLSAYYDFAGKGNAVMGTGETTPPREEWVAEMTVEVARYVERFKKNVEKSLRTVEPFLEALEDLKKDLTEEDENKQFEGLPLQ